MDFTRAHTRLRICWSSDDSSRRNFCMPTAVLAGSETPSLASVRSHRMRHRLSGAIWVHSSVAVMASLYHSACTLESGCYHALAQLMAHPLGGWLSDPGQPPTYLGCGGDSSEPGTSRERESGPAGRRGDSAGQHLLGDHRHAGVHVYPAVQQCLGELNQGQLLADLAQQRIRCDRIHRQAGRHSACFTVGHSGNLVDRSQQRKVHHDAADLPDVLGALGPVLLHLGCLP